MAIDPNGIDVVSLDKLDTITLSLSNYFASTNVNGVMGKSTLSDLASFVASYVPSAGAVPIYKATVNALPTPSQTYAILFVGAGTFTHASGNVTTTAPLNVLGWNGTAWSLLVGINIDLSGYATTASLAGYLPLSEVSKSKQFNYLSDNNSDLTLWTLPATGGITIDFVNSPGTLPASFVKKSLRINATSGKNGYVIDKVPVTALSDRFIVGAWFYKPVLDVTGVSTIGFYGQIEKADGTLGNYPILFAKASLTLNNSNTSAPFKSQVLAVEGDWVYLAYWNTADLPTGTVNIIVNPYTTGTSTVAAYNSYINNLTYLKGVSEINPSLVYDNNSYASADLSDFKKTALTRDGKLYNYLYEGTQDLGFWALPSSSYSKSFVDSPGILPFMFAKKSLKTTAPANANNFSSHTVPVAITDRIIYGAWFYKPVLDITGITSVGFYGQFTGISATRQLQFSKAQLVVGATRTSVETTATVEAIAGDWAYISMKNTADFPAGTTGVVVNPFATSGGTSASFDLYINNPTFLKGYSSINPYTFYDNSAFIYEIISDKSGTSTAMKGKKLGVEGDSIMEQGFVTSNIVARTGCTLINTAKSGSGYVVNNNGTIRSRIAALLAQNPDALYVAGLTNDWWLNVPIGSSAVINDDTQFYSAVYNTFKTIKTTSPTLPVLVATATQRYYQGATRDTKNTLNLTLEDYNKVLKDVARIFSIEVIDLYAISGITFENINTYTSDGLHPNTAGGVLEGKNIVPVLNRLAS